jgi:hypothetical protein
MIPRKVSLYFSERRGTIASKVVVSNELAVRRFPANSQVVAKVERHRRQEFLIMRFFPYLFRNCGNLFGGEIREQYLIKFAQVSRWRILLMSSTPRQ